MNDKVLDKLLKWFKYGNIKLKDLSDDDFEMLFKETDILRTILVFERSIRENHR